MRSIVFATAAAVVFAASAVHADDPLLRECPSFTIKDGARTGIYSGQYSQNGHTLAHTLVVQTVEEGGRASVLYAHGRQPAWNIEPGCIPMSGTFTDDNTLVVRFKHDRKAVYEFFEDFVNVSYTSPNGITRGQLKPKGTEGAS